MSKKNFTGGLNSLLGETRPTKKPTMREKRKKMLEEVNQQIKEAKLAKAKVGRPVTQTKEITKSSQEGTKENETRATFIVNEDLLEKLKAIAYWDRVLIKEVVNTALEDAIAKYEKKNKGLKPIPKK